MARACVGVWTVPLEWHTAAGCLLLIQGSFRGCSQHSRCCGDHHGLWRHLRLYI